jgi:hypothetical protein
LNYIVSLKAPTLGVQNLEATGIVTFLLNAIFVSVLVSLLGRKTLVRFRGKVQRFRSWSKGGREMNSLSSRLLQNEGKEEL